MKDRKTLATLFVLAALLLLPLVVHAQETDPASVVMAEMEAINAGDLDALLELYAEDMVMMIVMGPSTDVMTGHAEIGPWAQDLMDQNFRFEYEDLVVDGDTATWTAKSYSDSINALGVAPLVATSVATVQDGKLQEYTWTLSDESFAAYAAALAALPETGGGPLPVQAIVVLLGGLAAAGGLGLECVRRRLP